MAILPRPSGPRALWADFKKAFLRQQERTNFYIAALSVCITGLILFGFYHDAKMTQPKAQIVYAQSWPATRTDEEIIKQNVADQKALDARRLEQQKQYQRLADKLGIDY